MSTTQAEQPTIYLNPMEVWVSRRPALVKTILGSCVAITLYHSRKAIGAICHCALPTCTTQETCFGHCPERFRIVDCTILYMLKRMDCFNADRHELEIKLFGGANTLESYGAGNIVSTVGPDNVQAAIQTIKSQGLTLAASDVGGKRGRKIRFNTTNGEVMVQRFSGVQPVPEIKESDL